MTTSTTSSSPSTHPSYAELADLPAFATMSVPTAFEDLNGHLNIRHYLGIASEGLDESLVEVGILQQWPTVAGSARLHRRAPPDLPRRAPHR